MDLALWHCPTRVHSRFPPVASPTDQARSVPKYESATGSSSEEPEKSWDVFVSHNSVDRDSIVLPLIRALEELNLRVWSHKEHVPLGSPFATAIEEALSNARLIAVVLSPDYLSGGATSWTRQEFAAALSLENAAMTSLLVIRHNITERDILRLAPLAAARNCIDSSDGAEGIAARIREVVEPTNRRTPTHRPEQDESSLIERLDKESAVALEPKRPKSENRREQLQVKRPVRLQSKRPSPEPRASARSEQPSHAPRARARSRQPLPSPPVKVERAEVKAYDGNIIAIGKGVLGVLTVVFFGTLVVSLIQKLFS